LEALSHIDEIAKTPGLDGVFIGPGDLAASMGHLGNPAHAEVQAVIEKAAETLKGHGLASGNLATNPEDANRYLALGFTFVAANVDTILLATAADTLRKSLTI
jgi:4-hydroxy-2-oxoheptanedioate aldolase